MAAHLTFAERQFLHRMVKAKKSKTEIGALMNRHRSTIYRELARNSNRWGYRPEAAQRWAQVRREACRRPYKLKKDIGLRLYHATVIRATAARCLEYFATSGSQSTFVTSRASGAVIWDKTPNMRTHCR
jgi:IS30 family transposase